MVYDDLSSEDLMPLVASGDKRAFSCLMNRHRKTVYGVVYRFFKTSQEAEDVFQDVFLAYGVQQKDTNQQQNSTHGCIQLLQTIAKTN